VYAPDAKVNGDEAMKTLKWWILVKNWEDSLEIIKLLQLIERDKYHV